MASLVFDLVMIAALGPFTLFCLCSSGLLSSYRICGLIKGSVFDLVAFGNLVLDTIAGCADAVYDAVVPYMIAFAIGICVLGWAGVVRIGERNGFMR